MKSDTQNKRIKIKTLSNQEQSFYLYYYRNNKAHLMKIASHGTDIDTVRRIASDIESRMSVDAHYDPLLERQKARRETKHVDITLHQLFTDYLDDINKKKSHDKIQQIYNNNIKDVLGDRKINTIEKADIVELKRKIIKRAPYVANSVITYLRSAFNFAIESELVEKNPCNRIKKHEDVERNRILSNDELRRVFKVLDEKAKNKNNHQSVAFIKLLIFTGARVSEIANMRFSDIKDRVIRLSQHKTDHLGQDKIIYLNDYTLSIINALKRTHDNAKIIGIKSPRHLWDAIRKEANIEDVRLHDLRHTYVSFGINSRTVSFDEMKDLVGHKDAKSTQRYLTRSIDTNLANADAVSNELLNLIN